MKITKKVLIDLIYKNSVKYVVFTKQVTEMLNSYKQLRSEQHESGGILLGKVYKDVIVVDKISAPSKEDKSGRFHFERNVEKAQEIIKNEWKDSNGERIYLGEWHTHPENMPSPSSDDKKLIKNMLKDSIMEIDFLLMLIIGMKSNYIAVLQKGEKTLHQLKKVDTSDGLEITFYQNDQGGIFGFKVGGYLDYAPKGYDIYNAVFSQIFLGIISSILSLTNVRDYSLEETEGFIRFAVPELKYQIRNEISLLFDSLYLQVQMVINEMDERVIEKKVRIKMDNL
ncbi:Mov34/MPN/PAD-1 family protein [Bacillus sp. AFS077874]|uniref:Mov34/MPN/PAD-1 family protein n=1 Tax=Bacillus sp. AFS077874 TaxID=2033513 RepID=UPI001596BC22|nr:Mov34/MPN/PAD-1 family protein [Bacillus sp. AFS077874]